MHYFRNILFLAFIYFIPLQNEISAQNIIHGKVSGTLTDSSGSDHLQFVTVVLLRVKDSTAKAGGSSDVNGNFLFENIEEGKYFLRCDLSGYTEFNSHSFSVTGDSSSVDLGKIKLTADKKMMSTVVISDEKSDYSSDADKKVYEVGKNLTATGGTATDVLQNVPSVTVDNDGNISLHGSANVTVLIDGKPSGITGEDRQAALQQIPANMIERIEVITNPSSKYDAQGMGGIINIVTKKGSGKGWNGNATAGAGTNNKYNGSVAVSDRTDKINFYANYNYRYEEKWGKSYGSQHTFTSDTDYFYQYNGGSMNRSAFHNGKIGADFYLNENNTLSISGAYTMKTEKKNDSTMYSFMDKNQQPFSGFQRNTWTNEKTGTADASADYKHIFKGKKQTLNVLGSFSSNEKQQSGAFQNDFYGFENPPYEKNNGTTDFISSIAQADYSNAINDSVHLDAGLKYSLRRNNSLQEGDLYDFGNNIYNLDPRFSDHFIFDESVYAAYAQYTERVHRITYQAGARTEYTDLHGASESTGINFHNPYLSFFPSANIVFDIKTGEQFRVSYSRRLNRPNNQQINPYIDYSDSIMVRTGNPYLKPEFIHSVETEFSKSWEIFSVSATGYYRHTDNMISWSRIFDTLTGKGEVKPRNFSSSDNVGMDLVIRSSIGKKINAMLSASGYESHINGENIEAGLQTAYFGWNGKISLSWKITKDMAAQLNGNYGSPMKQPLGSFQMPGGIDLGMRQDFFKGRMSITLNVADIFNTKRMNIKSYNTGYDFTGWKQKESRIGMFTLSWIFGQGNDQLKKKAIIQQEENSGGE
ncbi:MAG: TonB-dependent receptor [Bacteroidetes bacterium]|nr:TonB-dependent receptor [Bacteroidota bacterium]